MNILTLSIGRHILEEGSRDRARMRLYAEHLNSFHIIVLTRHEHGFSEVVHEGNLHMYPTNSLSRVRMLTDAFRIGRAVLKMNAHQRFTISAQDPFEIGLVSYVLARVSGARFHVQLHGDYFDSLWRGKSFSRAARLVVARFLLTRACGIRVASERIQRSLLRRHIPQSKIAVLPIRPELETFLAAKPSPRAEESFVCMTASRLAPEKNIPLMLRAFAALRETHKEAQLRIVGSGGEERTIKNLIRALGIEEQVTLIPWSSDVSLEMAQADVFLLASDHEAYGLVLVEALAAGLPVITTDVGCVGEVVRDDVHGIVVPPRDETAFSAALTFLAEHPLDRKRMGEAGKATARTLGEVSESMYAERWVEAHSCTMDGV